MEEIEDIRRESSAPLSSAAVTEKPVIQLEIPPQWTLWRIYHSDCVPWRWRVADAKKDEESNIKDEGRDLQVRWASSPDRTWYVRSSDPMDEEDFDEAASFPSFKPDRDLFGPPRHCRRQRGWHYVKRWPPVVHVVDCLPQEESATGADVPPELFNNIVSCLLQDHGIKSWLGTLRLVCRHWERLCMRQNFRKQTLRAHEDVMDRLAGLEKRCGWGWQAYPIWDLHLRLDITQTLPGWIHIVQTKLVSTLDAPPDDMGLEITGPLPAGQRLTSIYLSSPCRSLWCPLRINNLKLKDLHFRKLDDLVRVLRELPFLETMEGWRITSDSPPDVYPRATSFIPGQRSSNTTEYHFEDSPHLAAMLACTMSPSGTPPIAHPDADLLCALASTFALARRPQSMRSSETITMCNNTVHVGIAPTQSRSQTRTVQVVVLEPIITQAREPSDAQISWERVADCVEKLVSRPNLFLVFSSLHSASVFHRDLAIPKMSRLILRGTLRYVLEEIRGTGPTEATRSLIEPDGDDGWRVLATEHFRPPSKRMDHNVEYSRFVTQLVRRIARLPDG